MGETKQCKSCGKLKPNHLYARAWDRPDGYEYVCRACHRVKRGTTFEVPTVDDPQSEITIDVLIDDAIAYQRRFPRDWKLKNATDRLLMLHDRDMAFNWRVSTADNGVRDLLYKMWERRMAAKINNEDRLDDIRIRLPIMSDDTEENEKWRHRFWGDVEL